MSKPLAISLAGALSVIGALAALVLLAIHIEHCDPLDFGHLVVFAAMALLFFAAAGCFLVDGKKNQITAAAIVAFNVALIIVACGYAKLFGGAELGILLICVIIPGVVLCTKTGKDWFNAERI